MPPENRPVRVAARVLADHVDAGPASAVRHALALAGVREDAAASNGVLLLDPGEPGAVDSVAAWAGPGRLLVLCTPPRPVGHTGWALLRAGAAEVLPFTGDAVAATVAERLRRWAAVDDVLQRPYVRDFLVGESPAWRTVLREAVEAARFTAATVLITGESGTGKERMAQLIHDLDPRPAKKKLVILDASTVLPSLSGSEFFGHEKGAFTGASAVRAGAFELADGGTLFLDEVGELPVTLQAELLRVIQEGTFKRVGSNLWRKSTFRLICATNRDLATERAEGAFRNDFFYRISGCTLHLPALRDRPGDIIPLVEHFFRQAMPGRTPPPIPPAVREVLLRRRYPGNVRDLRGLAMRIIHRHLGDGEISVGDLPESERPPGTAVPAPGTAGQSGAGGLDQWIRARLARGGTLGEITAEVQEEVIRLALLDQDAEQAARALGVPRLGPSAPDPAGTAAPAG